jgi:hypothetical protein
MIIECNVWCVKDAENENLGLPTGDAWMPIAIDLSKVNSVKLAGQNDFIGDDKAAVQLPNQVMTIDIPYKEFVILWKSSQ